MTSASSIGTIINERYRLDSELGKGGMGTVYQAFDLQLDRGVALKVLNPKAFGNTETQRLLNEARIIAKLKHPNIVTIHDVGEIEGFPFFVMEWVEGKSLNQQPPKDLPDTIQVIKAILAGLTHAHQKGIIHRDLKPANVLRDRDGTIKLVDFSIAHSPVDELTREGEIIGTINYLAPEIARGDPIDGRTDLYSLGVMFYEFATHKLPFEADNPFAVVTKHLFEDAVPAREINPQIPEYLNELITNLLRKSPAERPAGPEEVLQILETVNGAPGKTPPTSYSTLNLPTFLKDTVKGTPLSRPVFVRRQKELFKLRESLERTISGEGSVIFVSGEPGRGKTSLARVFIDEAQSTFEDLLVLTGTCNAYSGFAEPYHPFKEIFGYLTGDLQTPWLKGKISHEQAVRLWNVIPLITDALLSRGPELFNVLFQPSVLKANAEIVLSSDAPQISKIKLLADRQLEISTEIQQSMIFSQCTNVLEILSQDKPVLLFLDDLHWADPASLSLLFHLGMHLSGSRIFILGAYRADEVARGRSGERHPLDPLLNEFKRKFGDFIINLDKFDHQEGRKFVDAFLDTEKNLLGENFRLDFFRQTEGYPLFAVELLRAMQERGDLYLDDEGRWLAKAGLDWEALPSRVEGVIAERIERLDPSLREILRTACVEGEDFTVQVISEILDMSPAKVIRVLSHELDKRHRLVREIEDRRVGRQRVSRYRFTHNLIQQYLYKELSAGERIELHAQVAARLESLYQNHTADIAVKLATNFSRARNPVKTVQYLQVAGDLALQQFAYQEAIEHFLNAFETIEANPRSFQDRMVTAQLFGGSGRAYLNIGDINGARENMSKSLAILDRPFPGSSAGLVFNILGQLILQIIHRLLPDSLFHLEPESETARRKSESALLYPLLGMIFYLDNETLPTVYTALRTLNLAEQIGPSPQLAEAYGTMVIATGFIPAHFMAEGYRKKANQVLEKIENETTSVRVAILIGVYYIGLGRWDDVDRLLEGPLSASEQHGDFRQWGECILTLANNNVLQGKMPTGQQLFQSMVDSTRARNNVLQLVWGLEGLGNLSIRLGQLEKAAGYLENALELLEKHDDQVTEIEVNGLLGLARLRSGDVDGALEAVQNASALLGKSLPTTYALFQGLTGIAEVYLDRWLSDKNRNHWEKLARQACRNLHNYARIFNIGRPMAWYYQGYCDWNEDKKKRAIKAWQKSLDEARKMKMPYEEGLANLALGLHLETREPAREYHLQQAVIQFAELGAEDMLEIARRALTR